MIVKLHAAAGALALILVTLFWSSSVLVELMGSEARVLQVKTWILYSCALLVVAMMAAGGSGAALARGRMTPWVKRKMSRMKIAAALGILVLVPSAFFLQQRAASGTFDIWFYAVQAFELAAGAVNAGMIALNMRDGVQRRRATRARAA